MSLAGIGGNTNEDLMRVFFFNSSLQSQTAVRNKLYLGFGRLSFLAAI